MLDKVESSNLEPYKDQVTEASLINEDLKGSKIIATKKLPQFDAEEWTLGKRGKSSIPQSRLRKRPSTSKFLRKGGTSLYGIDKLASAQVTDQFIGAYGLGDYDAITLRKLLTGKQAQAGVSIGGLSESVGGASTPNDFETLMQLIYLRFEKPRFDKEVHNTMMQRNYAAIENSANNPQKIMQDSVSMIMSNYNPRTLLFGKEFLDKMSVLNKSRRSTATVSKTSATLHSSSWVTLMQKP